MNFKNIILFLLLAEADAWLFGSDNRNANNHFKQQMQYGCRRMRVPKRKHSHITRAIYCTMHGLLNSFDYRYRRSVNGVTEADETINGTFSVHATANQINRMMDEEETVIALQVSGDEQRKIKYLEILNVTVPDLSQTTSQPNQMAATVQQHYFGEAIVEFLDECVHGSSGCEFSCDYMAGSKNGTIIRIIPSARRGKFPYPPPTTKRPAPPPPPTTRKPAPPPPTTSKRPAPTPSSQPPTSKTPAPSPPSTTTTKPSLPATKEPPSPPTYKKPTPPTTNHKSSGSSRVNATGKNETHGSKGEKPSGKSGTHNTTSGHLEGVNSYSYPNNYGSSGSYDHGSTPASTDMHTSYQPTVNNPNTTPPGPLSSFPTSMKPKKNKTRGGKGMDGADLNKDNPSKPNPSIIPKPIPIPNIVSKIIFFIFGGGVLCGTPVLLCVCQILRCSNCSRPQGK